MGLPRRITRSWLSAGRRRPDCGPSATGRARPGRSQSCFVAQHFHAAHLWVNDHDGTFSQTDAGYFKSSDRHDCLAADFNRDGLEDIFCGLGTDRGTAMKSNQLYIQHAGHTFTEQAYQWYVSDPVALPSSTIQLV
jgi:FG-GAP-like repeat